MVGLAVSERLAASGHQVVTCARGAGATFQCDVTVVSDVERMRSQSGPVGILINDAGGALSAPFLKTSADDLDRQLALNLKGAFYCTQAYLPAMIEKSWSHYQCGIHRRPIGYRYIAAHARPARGDRTHSRSLALEVAETESP